MLLSIRVSLREVDELATQLQVQNEHYTDTVPIGRCIDDITSYQYDTIEEM